MKLYCTYGHLHLQHTEHCYVYYTQIHIIFTSLISSCSGLSMACSFIPLDFDSSFRTRVSLLPRRPGRGEFRGLFGWRIGEQWGLATGVANRLSPDCDGVCEWKREGGGEVCELDCDGGA